MTTVTELGLNMDVVLYTGAIGLVVIGLSGLLLLNNVFRMLLSLVLLESGANFLLLLSGFRDQGIAPIFMSGMPADFVMNDPVPQALVLTAIVIGVGIQALALALIIRVKQHYGTLNMDKIRSGLEQDIAQRAGVSAPASQNRPLAPNTEATSDE